MGCTGRTRGGRTWSEEICPPEWTWEETFKGRTYQRGVRAILSRDHGLTWDTEHEIMRDRFELADASPHPLPCGHLCSMLLADGSIITAYGHYPSKGGCLIRWKPMG